MSESVEISFPLDQDGFLSQECPSCLRRFKAVFTQEPNGKVLSFCPYCGHHGQECWWTTEQVDYIQTMQKNLFVNPLLRNFQRDIQSLNNPRGGFSVKTSPIRDDSVTPPTETDAVMPIHTFTCCVERVKFEAGAIQLYCIICGRLDSIKATPPTQE